MTRSIVEMLGALLVLLISAHDSIAQQAATIHVLLLDGNNGKPLKIGNTGKTGAPLSLTIFANCGPGHICFFPDKKFTWGVDGSGWTEVPVIENLKSLQLMKPTDQLVYCQGTPDKYGALDKDPEFAVDEILRRGVVAPNTCNRHLNIQSHPGVLIFFLRPLTWWEQFTKPPQM